MFFIFLLSVNYLFIFYFKVTLIEVLPKEKKQKEEKIQAYGQSVFELYYLLKGELLYTAKLPVYPTSGSTLEQQSPDAQLV